jgi:UDP-N-acetylmuramoylalanine--D-glutamate ligase
MIPSPRVPLPGRRPLVVGAARSGLAAARLLARRGLEVALCDRAAATDLAEEARALGGAGVATFFGRDDPGLLEGRDAVVWSPGIPADHPLARAARAAGLPLLGELELAWRATGAPFVCVTGTNGKSTTTDLVAALLRGAGRGAAACGNIGRPACDVVDDLAEGAVVVAEVSSFQLETVDLLKPEVATWLNLTADHLDRHGDLETYARVKRRLFLRQDREDVAAWSADDPAVASRMALDGAPSAPRALRFSVQGPVPEGAWVEGGALVLGAGDRATRLLPVAELRLRGRHNLANVVAALASVARFRPPADALRAALRAYRGLEHRLEPVGSVAGVEFVNDSKATNLASLRVALESFASPVVLIAGGRDKGQDFRPLAGLVARKAAAVVLIGEGAERIARSWSDVPTIRVPTLEMAVDAAFRHARRPGPGRPAVDTVLLSPGCASFDMFRDFEDRGRRFKAEVERLRVRGVGS